MSHNLLVLYESHLSSLKQQQHSSNNIWWVCVWTNLICDPYWEQTAISSGAVVLMGTKVCLFFLFKVFEGSKYRSELTQVLFEIQSLRPHYEAVLDTYSQILTNLDFACGNVIGACLHTESGSEIQSLRSTRMRRWNAAQV